jgi:hypothetical protein
MNNYLGPIDNLANINNPHEGDTILCTDTGNLKTYSSVGNWVTIGELSSDGFFNNKSSTMLELPDKGKSVDFEDLIDDHDEFLIMVDFLFAKGILDKKEYEEFKEKHKITLTKNKVRDTRFLEDIK